MHQTRLPTSVSQAWSVLLLAALALLPLPASALTVAAANSTCNLMEQIGAMFTDKHGIKVEFICKSSGLLAKGLEGKSLEADVFLSASQEWMDKLNQAGLMAKGSVQGLWGNRIVVAAPEHTKIRMTKFDDLSSDNIHKVISGDPSTMPLGRHVKEALEASGQWLVVREKIETKKHITLVADALSQADEYTVGFLFKTNLNPDHQILFVVDPTLHESVNYYIGRLVAAREKAQAEKFIEFLQGAEARAIIEKAGFSAIPQ